MQCYVDLLSSLHPHWQQQQQQQQQSRKQSQQQGNQPARGGGGRGSGGVGGPVFSRMTHAVADDADVDEMASAQQQQQQQQQPTEQQQQKQEPKQQHVHASLHELAAIGDAAAIHRALHDGADVDQRDAQSCTPLHFAADRGVLAVLQLLLAAGADVRATVCALCIFVAHCLQACLCLCLHGKWPPNGRFLHPALFHCIILIS